MSPKNPTDPKPGGAQGAPTSAAPVSPSRAAVPGTQQKMDATTFSVLPHFQAAALMPQTAGKLLSALKSQITQLTIEQSSSGIRHEDGRYAVLPRTLRSAWMAKVRHSVGFPHAYGKLIARGSSHRKNDTAPKKNTPPFP